MKIAVIGMGYVGLVSAVVWTNLGHTVIGVENNSEKLQRLLAGEAPFFEPGLHSALAEAMQSGRLTFVETLVAGSTLELVFICVGTPIGVDGLLNDQYLLESARMVGMVGDANLQVVIKSTILPKMSDKVLEEVRLGYEERGLVFKGGVYFSPEFLSEGSALRDTLTPSRVVIGGEGLDQENLVVKFLKSVTPEVVPIVITDIRSAELSKLAANAMLASRISFINELALVADMVEGDINLVAKIIGLDPRIGPNFLKAGVGFGGGCFPKDTNSLINYAKTIGIKTGLLEAVVEVNQQAVIGFYNRVVSAFGDPVGKRLGILGLAYKEGTDDLRSAAALEIIERWRRAGGMVVAFDPLVVKIQAEKLGITSLDDATAVLSEADLLMVLTAEPEFINLDWERVSALYHGEIIGDGRRLYLAKVVNKAGFKLIT